METDTGMITTAQDGWSGTLRRRGATILALFALLWVLVAASGLPAGAAWPVRGGGLAVSVALLLLTHRRGGSGEVEPTRRQPRDWRRRVAVVNLGQFVIIAVVVVACLAVDAPQLVAPLVCLVVGLHFLPLAGSFDQPEYRWTATGMCLGAVAGLLVLLLGPSMEVARVVVGSVAAATLWGTSLRLALRR